MGILLFNHFKEEKQKVECDTYINNIPNDPPKWYFEKWLKQDSKSNKKNHSPFIS